MSICRTEIKKILTLEEKLSYKGLSIIWVEIIPVDFGFEHHSSGFVGLL